MIDATMLKNIRVQACGEVIIFNIQSYTVRCAIQMVNLLNLTTFWHLFRYAIVICRVSNDARACTVHVRSATLSKAH